MKFNEILTKTKRDISKNRNFALSPPPFSVPQPQIEILTVLFAHSSKEYRYEVS